MCSTRLSSIQKETTTRFTVLEVGNLFQNARSEGKESIFCPMSNDSLPCVYLALLSFSGETGVGVADWSPQPIPDNNMPVAKIASKAEEKCFRQRFLETIYFAP